MYNEDLKSSFIAECADNKSNIQRAIRLFNAAEPFEKEWGRDICTMPEESLGKALIAMTGARLGTQSVDMSILRKYAKWCLDNNVQDACDGLLKQQDVNYDKLRETMVSSPEQLQSYLDRVFSPVEDCRPDNLCRGFFWMAFMGFEESELAEIRTENVDLKNSAIRFGGKLYKIYDEAIPVIKYLCTANSFIYDYVRYETVVARDVGTQILRGMRVGSGVNTESIGRLASTRIATASKLSSQKVVIRYKSIRFSGIFYRMYEEEKAGVDVVADRYLKFYFSNSDNLHERRLARKAVELMTDYQRWKKAFDK